ncbi:MAG: hypothetical protein IKH65_09065 [Clostridia bacterium]|jgi:hypothetical protein|nr:hypothetical protein [Clostridia bacterium]
MNKIYVKADVFFDEYGRMMPQRLIWEDGRKFKIDRVTDIRESAAMRIGSQRDRYTISLCGQERYLFFERSTNLSCNIIGRWFVEK